MAHDDHVSPEEARERLWELADNIKIAMFITWDGEKQRARPMAATTDKDTGTVYFLTSASSEKDWQIDKFPTVTLSFSDSGKNKYVTITGTAVVSNDRAKIKEIWSPFAKAWWDSSDDPDVRVIKVSAEDGEYWDSPNRLVATTIMLAAAVTKGPPPMGDNEKVDL